MSRIHVRPAAMRCPRFGLATVRAVLAAFGERSVWSGVDSDLTVVRIDRTQPLSTTNAMLLSVREAVHKVPREVLVRAKECLELYGLKDVEHRKCVE